MSHIQFTRRRTLKILGAASAGGALAACRGTQPPSPERIERLGFASTLLGGGQFERLTATAGQDSATNTGQPVGASVTVPAIDALLIRRV